MGEIYEKIMEEVREWRKAGYPCDDFSAIGEILNFNAHDGHSLESLKFLRYPQFEALEAYWYLRLKLNTPKFLDLYKYFFPKDRELARALGMDTRDDRIGDLLQDGELFDTISNDDEFVREYKLDTIREAMSLNYSSYIMALTMGSGKTILIATIIATEFAMSLEYDDEQFMRNALIFAPDKTIINSLREIADTPFELILPPRHYNMFVANYKLIYTEDGAKNINGLISGSSYNIIVTNTQKIIPRKLTKGQSQDEIDYQEKLKQNTLTVNLRLQSIASLPSIGVFSDEAHHTYGNKIGNEIKRVREAINFIGAETKIVCVVNTTGTPYAGKQTLKEVIYWYGLEQGIKDNILKSLEGSIITYAFNNQTEEEIIEHTIQDFFKEYGNHSLPNGAKAKIAFYFSNSEHLNESKEFIEKALITNNQPISLILQNTERSSSQEIEEFQRLNDPDNQRRVILLINKGTEGWNCPSLFATALIRQVTVSNNFILQSSTRCLRQVAGNDKPARIYIEQSNKKALDKELHDNFRTNLTNLYNKPQEYEQQVLTFQKTHLPKLEVTFKEQIVIAKEDLKEKEIILNQIDKTDNIEENIIYKTIYEPNLTEKGDMLHSTGEYEKIILEHDNCDIFTATKDIASRYHLSYKRIYNELSRLYSEHEIPKKHLGYLFSQIDEQIQVYEVKEKQITEALAIIKFYDGYGNEIFKRDHAGLYCHTIRYNNKLTQYILHRDDIANNKNDFGFHYTPYKFDSEPEQEFLKQILASLNAKSDEIQDIYFTGGLTNPEQTDFYFEYKDDVGKYRKYYPDYLVVKNDGSFVIIEIKSAGEENNPNPDTVLKQKAVEKIEGISGNHFKYHILYCDTPITPDKLQKVQIKLFS